MMRTFWCGVLVLLCGVVSSLRGYDLDTRALTPVTHEKASVHAPVVLVKDGKLQFVLAWDSKIETNQVARKSIRMAVDVLAQAFERCTGCRPQVVDIREQAQLTSHPAVILVGDSSTVRELGVDVKGLPDQGFTVRTFPRGVVIAGVDSSTDPEFGKALGQGLWDSSLGTLFGAYDFTERLLGMRYFLPGENGYYAPRTKSLVLRPFAYRDWPRFQNRGIYYYLWCSVANRKMTDQWRPYLGNLKVGDVSFGFAWRMGGTLLGGGTHAPRPERIAKSYPDKLKTIFYTSPTGKFWHTPKQHIGNYYNVLDLGFADLLIDSWKAFYASGGKDDRGGYGHLVNRDYVSFGVCDTYMPLSEVVNDPVVKRLGLLRPSDLRRDKDAGMCNIYARFYQYLCQRLKVELPDKKLFLLAYYNSKVASLDPRWRLPENLEIHLCTVDLPQRTRYKPAMDRTVELFRDWYRAMGNRPVKKAWLYCSNTNPFARAVIGEFVGDVPKVLGKYLGNGGMFMDFYQLPMSDYWFYYWSPYASARSQWNPDWDVDAGIDEHWDLYYGRQAGPHLKKFHRLLKDSYVRYGMPVDDPMPLYPAKVISQLERHLADAEACLKPGTVEMRRFQLLAAKWPENFAMQKARLAYEAPVYGVHRLLPEETITVDGAGLESVWRRIPELPLLLSETGRRDVRFPTSVKLVWGGDALYGLAVSKYPVKADRRNTVWRNDSFELFFSPGLKKEVKYQLAFDTLDQRFRGKERLLPIPQPVDLAWNIDGVQVRNQVDAEGWTAEFMIPFSVFEEGAPKAYDSWNFNLVRNKMAAPKEVASSSLTLGNNHNLTMFGILKFMGRGD